MAAVSDDELTERLRVLLTEVDMEKTSEKMVRKMLEEEFKVDLSGRKALIRDEITKCLAEIQAKEEEEDDYEGDEEDDEPAPREEVGKKRKKSGPPPILSQEMQEFLGCESMARTEITKKLWQYIKANNLQDPANKRNIIMDDKLSKLFTDPLTMFSMPKQLSNHVWSATKKAAKRSEPAGDNERSDQEQDMKVKKEEEEEDVKPKIEYEENEEEQHEDDDGEEEHEAEEEEEEYEEKPARRSTRSRSKPQSTKGEGKKRGGGGGGFMKPIKVTTELAEFLGTEEITRPALTKFMWAYFKSNGLQDPQDRRHILCDDKLKALMNVDRFKAFGFMKLLKHHVIS